MGYDMNLMVFKKKSLDRIKGEWADYSFSDIYSNLLFSRLYPDEYDFPEDEIGRCIYSGNRDILSDFFVSEIYNDEAVFIGRKIYNKIFQWLEEKLRSITLYDLLWEDDIRQYLDLMELYKCLLEEHIDFETEFVVFEHDW